jgi:hypothetical protein
MALDGSSYAVVSSYTKGTKAISLSAWVNINPAVAGTAVSIARNGEGSLRAPGDNNPVPSGQFDLGVTAEGNLWIQIQAGPNFPQVTSTATVAMGSWQHVAFTADGAQLRLYLNGQQVGVTDYLDDLKTSTVDFLSIGARLNTNDVGIIIDDTPNYMAGQIDDLAVWNRPLPIDEISKIYAAGQAGAALTTVTLTPPAIVTVTSPTIKYALSGGNLTLSWDAQVEFTLESSSTPVGPWITVTGVANNSVIVKANSGVMFYRLRYQQ